MKNLFIILVLVSASCTSPPEPAAVTVIYLMRHAEPDYPPGEERPRDPVLSEAGRRRARALADSLTDKGITRVFSSDFRRTRETAAPLADTLGLEVEIYDAFELEAFADSLRRMSGGIVVAGHSNTTPELVRLLGGDPGEPIDEQSEFDRLYTVTLSPDGAVAVTQSRYGSLE